MNNLIYMNQRKLSILASVILLSIGLIGCKTRPTGTAAQAGLSVASFVGPWIATSVEIATDGKCDKTSLIQFDSKEVAGSQGRKPAMTIFAADGSYREETYTISDSLVQSKAGFWHLFEDSLYMRVEGAGNQKIAFKATVEGKGLMLLSQIDWDADGERDDQMTVKLKRP